MKLIRISAIWCSSCLIMRQRFNDVIKDYDIVVEDLDYDLDYEKIEQYHIGNTLPVYIYNNKKLVGEHTKEEIRKFLEE